MIKIGDIVTNGYVYDGKQNLKLHFEVLAVDQNDVGFDN